MRRDKKSKKHAQFRLPFKIFALSQKSVRRLKGNMDLFFHKSGPFNKKTKKSTSFLFY